MGRHKNVETIRKQNKVPIEVRKHPTANKSPLGRRPVIDWNHDNLNLLHVLIRAGLSNLDLEIRFGCSTTTLLCGCRILIQNLSNESTHTE